MDVVRTNVEKIGGKVEIDSRPGKGTTLRLRIPLTLAIIPALIVRSLNQSFALPQGALSELVHVSAGAGRHGHRVDRRCAPLPIARQAAAAGLSRPAADARAAAQNSVTERDNFIAVLDADGRHFGLVVDGLADPEEIVVKPLSAVLKGIGLYSGATVLGNAELALILDPGAIALRAGIAMRGEDEAREQQREDGERTMQSRVGISAGGDRGTPGRGAAGRRAAHRADPGFAHRVHRATGR